MQIARDTERARALPTTSTPTRRATLFGSVAAFVGIAAVALPRAVQAASTGLDAALIGMCAEFCEMERMLFTIHDGPDAELDEDVATTASMPLWDRQRALAVAIAGSRAHTADGLMAVAHALATYASDGSFAIEPSRETVGGQLSMTLMRETLRFHGQMVPDRLLRPAAVPVVVAATSTAPSMPGPDAALLALHRDFLAQDALCHAWNDKEVSGEIGEQALDRWLECIEAAAKMPARTLTGLRAKADIALKGLVLFADSEGIADDFARAVLVEIAA